MTDLDVIVPGEAGARLTQHLVTEVEADTARAGPRREHERERVAVAGAEVEHTLDACRQELEHHLECVDRCGIESRSRR